MEHNPLHASRFSEGCLASTEFNHFGVFISGSR